MMKTDGEDRARQKQTWLRPGTDFRNDCVPSRLLDVINEVASRSQGSARIIVFLLLAFSPFVSVHSGSASTEPITYVVSANVSAEDAAVIEEAITLARNYLSAGPLSAPSIRLFVNVRNTSDTTGSQATAFFSPGFLAVFVGSTGWIQISPVERVHVIVHEYIHAYQYAVLGDAGTLLPSWLIEGMAEYLSYDAVAQQGLVDLQDVLDFHTWEVGSAPEMESLSRLETAGEFYNAYGPVYSLGYLALNHLMENRPVQDLEFFMQRVATGTEWTDAFDVSFGTSLAGFYTSFTEILDEMIAPIDNPAAFERVEPENKESSISIESTSWRIGEADQLTVIAHSKPGSICELRLRGVNGESRSSRTTVADGAGKLFWLVTVLADTNEGTVQMTASCGGDRTAIRIPFH